MAKIKNIKSNEKEAHNYNFEDLKRLFHISRVRECDDQTYELKLISGNIHKLDKHPSYLESVKNIIKLIEDNNYPVEYLIQIQDDKEYLKTQEYNYISYGEAIKVFSLFDKTENEVAKAFIVLQFFIYYINKKDKNRNEIHKFLAKVVLDNSLLVASCFRYFKKYFKENEIQSLELFLLIINNIPLLESSLTILQSSTLLFNLFEENMLIILKGLGSCHTYSRFMIGLLFEGIIVNQIRPTHEFQLKFLEYFANKLKSETINSFIIESRRNIDNNNKNQNQKSNNGVSGIEDMGANLTVFNNQRKEVVIPNYILTKIIEYTLKNDQFLDGPLLKSTQFRNEKSKGLSENDEEDDSYIEKESYEDDYETDIDYSNVSEIYEDWDDVIETHIKAIFNVALVSKRFYHITSQVLENSIDFSTFEANKILRSQINFGSPYCFFKKPLKSIRYDALIRTTPYNYIDEAFSAVESLVFVGDTFPQTEFSPYDYCSVTFSTFPNSNSMPNLKKLSIVGRASKGDNRFYDTSGLFLLKHFIANCGAKLEEFTLNEQLSLNYPKNFDVSLIKLLLDIHSSTLKIIRIKFDYILKRMRSYAARISELLLPFKGRINIQLYENDKLVNQFKDSNMYLDSDDGYFEDDYSTSSIDSDTALDHFFDDTYFVKSKLKPFKASIDRKNDYYIYSDEDPNDEEYIEDYFDDEDYETDEYYETDEEDEGFYISDDYRWLR